MENITSKQRHEIDARIEQLSFIPPQEFEKIGASDIQALLREFLTHLSSTERTSEEFLQIRTELEDTRKECIDLYEFAPVGYFNLDNHGAIVKANTTACDMLNIPKNTLTNQLFADLVEEHHRLTFTSYLGDIARSGSRLSTEVEMRRGDGSVFNAQLHAVPMLEKSAIVYRLSVSDITERKRAEKAINESEQMYRNLADLIPGVVFETDFNGKVTYANKKALASFNLSESDLSKGINIFDHITHEQRNTAAERFKAILREGDMGVYEYSLLRKDGTAFPALVHTTRIMREDKATGVRGIAIDITKQKQVEKALRESDERMRNVFESMDEGFALCEMIYDSAGKPVDFRFLEVNPAFARQTGFQVEQVVGHTVKEIIPSIEPFWIETYSRVVATGQGERINNPVAELKKRYEVHAWRSGPGRFAVVFHDITDFNKRAVHKTR